MYDAHIKAAEIAAQGELRDCGFNCSFEVAAQIFRSAAAEWARTRHLTEEEAIAEAAERHFQEIGMER